MWLLLSTALAAAPLSWPAPSRLEVTATTSARRTGSDGSHEEIAPSTGQFVVEATPTAAGTRLAWGSKDGTSPPLFVALLAPDGTLGEPDVTGALKAAAERPVGDSPALQGMFAGFLRRDMESSARQLEDAWARWVAIPAGAAWTWGLRSRAGVHAVPVHGTAATHRARCTPEERRRRCERFEATGEADEAALRAVATEHPEALRYLVGGPPPGRGEAEASEVTATLRERFSVITDRGSRVPISAERVVTARVTVSRPGEAPIWREAESTEVYSFALQK